MPGKQYGRRATPCKTLTEIDAAYIAGLLDGEGYIGFRRERPSKLFKRGRFMLLLAVCITNAEVLDWLESVTGIPRGKFAHRPKIAHHSVWYIWRATSSRGASLLEQVRPYMRIKGSAADWYLDTHRALVANEELAWDEDWRAGVVERFRLISSRAVRSRPDRGEPR